MPESRSIHRTTSESKIRHAGPWLVSQVLHTRVPIAIDAIPMLCPIQESVHFDTLANLAP
jgi:hypothetical protein